MTAPSTAPGCLHWLRQLRVWLHSKKSLRPARASCQAPAGPRAGQGGAVKPETTARPGRRGSNAGPLPSLKVVIPSSPKASARRVQVLPSCAVGQSPGRLPLSPSRPMPLASPKPGLASSSSSGRLLVSHVLLGKGGHSPVVRGRLGLSPVAVKVLSHRDPQAANELAAVKCLWEGHANVVASYPAVRMMSTATAGNEGFNEAPSHSYLPMELCDVDLLAYSEAKGGLEEPEAAVLFGQIGSGVLFMHSRRVYHLDLKPDNVLLVGGVPKLADFGSAAVRPLASPSRRTSPSPCAAHATVGAVTVGAAPTASAPFYVPHTACTGQYACPTSTTANSTQVVKLDSYHTATSSVDALKSSVSILRLVTVTSGTGSPALPTTREPAQASLVDAEKADVWSFGISLLVVVVGVFPWTSASGDDRRYAAWLESYSHWQPHQPQPEPVTGGNRLGLPLSAMPSDSEPSQSSHGSHGNHDSLAGPVMSALCIGHSQHGTPLSPLLVHLLRWALHPDPVLRCNMQQACSHPFFQAT